MKGIFWKDCKKESDPLLSLNIGILINLHEDKDKIFLQVINKIKFYCNIDQYPYFTLNKRFLFKWIILEIGRLYTRLKKLKKFNECQNIERE